MAKNQPSMKEIMNANGMKDQTSSLRQDFDDNDQALENAAKSDMGNTLSGVDFESADLSTTSNNFSSGSGDGFSMQDAIDQMPEMESGDRAPIFDSGKSQSLRDQFRSEISNAADVQFGESQTSAGRLNQMLASDSPLMARARTQGMQQANSRGLLNSSMAAGAAQGAMIDRAQPFALQDSGQFAQNARQNAQAENNRRNLMNETTAQSFLSSQDYQQQVGLNQQRFGELQADRDYRLASIDAEQQRLQSDLAEARAQNDFGREQRILERQADIQQRRDELLFGQEQKLSEQEFSQQQQLTDQQAEIQRRRDFRVAELDQEKMRLDSELAEARAQNDFGREQQILNQQANIQQERDDLLFGQQQSLSEQEFDQQQQLTSQQADIQAQRDQLLADQQIERDQRLSNLDEQQARLQADLAEAQAQNDFGRQQQLNDQQAQIQERRDELLADQQADRDKRIAGFDQEAQRLQSQLDEAAAQNDFDRQEQLVEKQAEIQQKRDELLFEQDLDATAQEYGLRSEEIAQEGEQAMKELFGTSLANAWGVMGNNVTDIVAQSLIEINDIQTNPNIDPADKTEMIEQVKLARDEDAAFQTTLYGQFPFMLQDSDAFPEMDLGADSFAEKQVLDAYQDILGRAPSNENLAFYTRRVNNEGIDQVKAELSNSPEARNS